MLCGGVWSKDCLLQVKRIPGSSGRVHKNTEGEWVWSDDEMKDTSNEPGAEPVSQVLLCLKALTTVAELLQRCCGRHFSFGRFSSYLCAAITSGFLFTQLEF